MFANHFSTACLTQGARNRLKLLSSCLSSLGIEGCRQSMQLCFRLGKEGLQDRGGRKRWWRYSASFHLTQSPELLSPPLVMYLLSVAAPRQRDDLKHVCSPLRWQDWLSPFCSIGCGHQPSLQTPVFRLGEGVGMERGRRAEEQGFLFYKQGKLHPGLREGRGVGRKCGKGMMSVGTLSYHWQEKEEDCHASLLLPGAKLVNSFPIL